VESTLFGDTATAIVPLRAPDLVYSPHLYTAGLVPKVLSPGPHPIEDSIGERRREAALLPAALWFGELGVQHSWPEAGAWADRALAALDSAGSGWAWWQWRQDGGWGIRSESGGSLDLEFLRHLARPYLRAAPAGVTASVGGSGRLAVKVPSSTAPTTLVVAWPALLYAPPAVSMSCAARPTYDSVGSVLTIAIPAGGGCTLELAPS
jgi:hypothetical protein